jgi:hypothetical protein
VSLSTLAFPSTAPSTTRPALGGDTAAPSGSSAAAPTAPASSARAARRSGSGLAGQLNREWAQLTADVGALGACERWADGCPALRGVRRLDDVLLLVASCEPPTRDAVLLHLLERAQSGDQLAGRTLLQAMLGKAVRVAGTLTGYDDVRGDRDEALARSVAALWQAISTYPVARRPARVAANLALDTVAIAQRGHTGSSHRRPRLQETPVADLTELAGAWAAPACPAAEAASGPPDAELLVLLAWAVRHGVITLAEAQLLLRVYSVDSDGRPVDGRTVAADLGLSWPALRQRCHRLARRLAAATADADLGPADPPHLERRAAA